METVEELLRIDMLLEYQHDVLGDEMAQQLESRSHWLSSQLTPGQLQKYNELTAGLLLSM
jgi:hypothetical protein